MKKFIEVTAEIKSFASMIFAGLIIVYTVFGGFFGLKEISFSLVWQALFISAIASILHFVVFTDVLAKKMRYGAKLTTFAIFMLFVLTGFAYFFKWFPVESGLYWLIFVLICLFFFGIVTLVFKMYFRVTGKKYTELLDAYKAKQKA